MTDGGRENGKRVVAIVLMEAKATEREAYFVFKKYQTISMMNMR